MVQTIHDISRLSIAPLLLYALMHWRGFIMKPMRLLRWMVAFLAASEVVSYVSFRLMPNNLILFSVYTIGEMFFVLQIITNLRFTPILQKVYYALFVALSLYMLYLVFSSHAYPTLARLGQACMLFIITFIALLHWLKLGQFNVWQLCIILAFNARFLFILFSHLGFRFNTGGTILELYVLKDMMNIGSNILLFISMYFYLNQHQLYEKQSY